MQAKHITEEPDVGNEVPTFLQNSLSSLKVPPLPIPTRATATWLREGPNVGKGRGGGGIRPLVPQSQKNPLEVVRLKPHSEHTGQGWNLSSSGEVKILLVKS